MNDSVGHALRCLPGVEEREVDLGERVDLEDPSWGCLPLGWPRVDRRETDGNVLLPSLMMFAMVHAFSFEEESLAGVGRGWNRPRE